ncbi:zinc-binding dehydrogenase [Streptomyces sp. TRM75563]|uniref:zinc-binding dehydrogenase n=1 Tax=Streptomyces sp. TRM75563 TaxID=2817418 RepID=UPI001F6261D1|nr:zinc-binding dehydrogenase [Streptomyces sp. TRM75563]MCI4043735.1 zinc-binding dehydrogenase [Streptomyces sp. TRM75563]
MVPDRIGDTAGLDRLCRQAEAGVLTPRVARVLPAAEAARAHRLLEAGGCGAGWSWTSPEPGNRPST